MYQGKRLIHLFLDNARHHHADLAQDWLAQPGCRIKPHFIRSYCPHLNPIERLSDLMHSHTTHNKCHPTLNGFTSAVITLLRYDVPKKWHQFRDRVTDNFRVIDPPDFRAIA